MHSLISSPSFMRSEKAYKDILDAISDEGRLRSLCHSRDEGMLDCTSNDYMGLGADKELLQSFVASLDMNSMFGSCASRLLFTGADRYAVLEDYLEREYGRKALIFNSGYHANTGIIPALCAADDTLIVADKLVHASIIDGMKLSGAKFRRFKHNDVSALRRILESESSRYQRLLVVVESVYSMDGDEAPLRDIIALKDSCPAIMLYVDEAHAFGVRGDRGLGLCEELGVEPDILIGTLGKAAASTGAFAITSDVIKDYLVNTCRSLIFSTAIPPVSVDWSLHTLKRLRQMQIERKRIAEMSVDLSSFIANLTGVGVAHSSPIIPLHAGGNERVVALAEAMKRHGVMALPIRRPTVAAGTERVRISLHASMSTEDISRIKYAAEKAFNESGIL